KIIDRFIVMAKKKEKIGIHMTAARVKLPSSDRKKKKKNGNGLAFEIGSSISISSENYEPENNATTR
ncbi:MAG: hypothetical protein AB8B47_02625, partial [Roseobacter sp.]